ncbi:MAG: hypothetical protein P1V13_11155 [Rhizobiaceae bacterium]|nr:hypothetical protein [Rhizobiaceae bacterium]
MITSLDLPFSKEIRVGILALTAVLAIALVGSNAIADDSGLPDSGFEIVDGRTTILITDPQNDFLSPDGASPGALRARMSMPMIRSRILINCSPRQNAPACRCLFHRTSKPHL